MRLVRNDSVEFEETPFLSESRTYSGAVLGDLIYPDVPARQACFWGGLVFGLISLAEFAFPELIPSPPGSRLHGVLFFLISALMVMPALALAPRPLFKVSFFLGLGLLAMAGTGFFLGAPLAEDLEGDRFYWVVMPGRIELGTRDHLLLAAQGVLLMFTATISKRRSLNEW